MKVQIGSTDDIFMNAYRNFKNNCYNMNSSIPEIKENYREVRNLFMKSGQIQEFYDKVFELTKKVDSIGKPQLCTLLLNELSKISMSFNLRETPENILERTIKRFQDNNDSMHELARIIDLEDVYQVLGNRRGLLRVLHQKKDCCKKILANYEESANNFVSIHRQPTSKESIQTQLAFTYSNLAQMLMRRKPQDAVALYKKSAELSQQLGNLKAVNYANKQINYIQRYNKKWSNMQ